MQHQSFRVFWVAMASVALAACLVDEGAVDIGELEASGVDGDGPGMSRGNENENGNTTSNGNTNTNTNTNNNSNTNESAGPGVIASLVAGVGVLGQSATVGTAVPVPPSVTVLDSMGEPRGGVQVAFTPSGDGAVSSATATTDSSGVASLAGWTLGTRAGPQTLSVTAGGAALTIDATATPDLPATIIPATDVDDQVATVGSALPVAPSVTVSDQYGNPTPSQAVTFAVSGGGGTVSGGSATTDVAGVATAAAWTLGTTAGANTLSVTAGSASATIAATGTAGPADVVRVGTGVTGQTAGIGSAVGIDPFVIVEDAFGNPVAGVTVTFSVSAGGGAVENGSDISDAAGLASAGAWTLGATPGANALTASVGSLSTTISATGTELELVLLGGNRQTAEPGSLLAEPLVVEVRSSGTPLAGVTVSFTTSGGGSFSPTSVVTDGSGQAQSVWTLGSALGLTAAEASVAGAPSVEFRAAATRYNIVLEYETTLSDTDREAFEYAEFIWEATITNDLLDFTAMQGAVNCSTGAGVDVDDLHIAVEIEPIDGDFGQLGSAGPCLGRPAGGAPLTGIMRFDSADTARLASEGRLLATILHEMGHVLGIGTLWASKMLLENPSINTFSPCDTTMRDTRFLGTATNAEYVALGGTGNTPLENDTSEWTCGSLDAHFRETTFGDELMTPLLNGGAPLSRMSIASLEDLGVYSVSYALGESYSLPSGGGLFDARPAEREWCGAQPVLPLFEADGLIVYGSGE